MGPSFGGLDASGLTLGLQFEQGAPVILRRDLYERGKGIVPVFEQSTRPRAAGVEMMALQEDAQPHCIKAQWVAHAVVVNARRALPRPVLGVGIIFFSCIDRFELYLALVAEARKAAVRVPDIRNAARHTGGEIAAGVADHRDDPAGHVLA